MSEWWTYSLSDFLLFSPRTYYRLFELYNSAIWPLQLVSLALGVAILGLLLREAVWRGRAIAAVLAGCWLWVAWAYFLKRYETINWAAEYVAIGFAVEALLLVVERDCSRSAPLPAEQGFVRPGRALHLSVRAFCISADRPARRPAVAAGRAVRCCARSDRGRDARCSGRGASAALGASGHSDHLVRDQRSDAVGHGIAGRPGRARCRSSGPRAGGLEDTAAATAFAARGVSHRPKIPWTRWMDRATIISRKCGDKH